MKIFRKIGTLTEFDVVAETELSYVGRTCHKDYTNWENLFAKNDEGKEWFFSLKDYEANEAKQDQLKARIAELKKEFA